jgi:antirestriction protein ArdC
MNKVYEIVTDRIIKMLEEGTIPWKKPWKGGAACNLLRKIDYRGINVFNLAHTPYSLPYWVSQKDLIKLSGVDLKDNVSKQEYMKTVTAMECRLLEGQLYKSNIVIYTNWLDRIDKDTGEINGKIPFTKYYRVWNVEQTTIPSIRPDLIPEVTNNPIDSIAAAENIILQYTNCPIITHNEARAYYKPSSDLVNMPKKTVFNTAEDYYATLFHELGHSTGHASRLNREFGAGFGSEKYAKEELVAELTSAFLCAKTQIDNSVIDNSAAYVQGWLKKIKEDKNILIWASSRAQKAADYIQGRIAYGEKNEEPEAIAA